MLDIKYIKDNIEEVKKAVELKKVSKKVDIDTLIQKHDSYLDKLKIVEEHRNLRNNLSKDISKVTGPSREKLLEEATELKGELGKLETELAELKASYEADLLTVPNVISKDTPIGVSEEDNVAIKTVGDLPQFDFTPRDHVELGEMLDIIDIETASKISGSRFYYLKNEAVFLELSIVRYVMDTLTNRDIIDEIAKKTKNKYTKPFVPLLPPLLIKADVAKKMDRYNPIEDRYYIEKDDMLFIGSAEHSLGPMFMDDNLDLKDLPLRYIGFSPSFRREAGSYGLDTRGIIRVHHFDKLEMESFSSIEDGPAEQELIIGIQEYLVNSLGLPYQVIAISSGDMGLPDYKQVDINTWIPSQDKYRETHTSDYMTDFQARRLNTTYTSIEGEREYVHMNDATAFAVGRIIVAILENYQQKDGSVKIPEVLQKYTGFDVITPKA